MKTKRFLVEIEIPEETGDLCWDQDETGLQAFHDCVVSALPRINLQEIRSARGENIQYQNFIKRQIDVRDSFKVVEEVL